MNIFGKLLVIAIISPLVGCAGPLHTPSLNAQNASNMRFKCGIVNVSQNDKVISIRVKDESGQTVGSKENVTIGAGEYEHFTAGVRPGGASLNGHCEFVVEGNKNDYRASACVLELGVGCVSAVSAR